MQTQFRGGGKVTEGRGIDAQRGAVDKAADRRNSPQSRELHGGLVDAVMQAEVVHADPNRARVLQRAACISNVDCTRYHVRMSLATSLRAPTRRAIYFIAVGCGAALIHFLTVVALVELPGWPPLAANVAGWLCAFGFSFTGHHRLTFAGHSLTVSRSASRFFLISAAGFAVNETVYAFGLHFSPLHYDLLLALILVAVAVLTFAASRYWAFADKGPSPSTPAP